MSGAPSPLELLAAEPDRFDLDQAAFLLAFGRDPMLLDTGLVAGLSLPLAEVAAADPAAMRLVTPLLGLIGPGGPLPRHHTATAAAEARRRNRAVLAFLEVLGRRLGAMWFRAGAKYRPARHPAAAERVLDALYGGGTPGLAGRLPMSAQTLRHHAGHLASRTRSAERLAALLSAEAGMPVEVVEFTGGWSRLPVAERSRLGMRHARLGVDALAGAQLWDPQAAFSLRLGPLDAAQFARLMPGRPLFTRIVALTRLHAGLEQDFVINPVLAAAAVPAARLGPQGARLGLDSWLAPLRPRRRPAADARLRPSP